MKRGSLAAQRNPDKPKGNKERIVNASVENVANNTRAGTATSFSIRVNRSNNTVEYEIHLVGNADTCRESRFHSRSRDRATDPRKNIFRLLLPTGVTSFKWQPRILIIRARARRSGTRIRPRQHRKSCEKYDSVAESSFVVFPLRVSGAVVAASISYSRLF